MAPDSFPVTVGMHSCDDAVLEVDFSPFPSFRRVKFLTMEARLEKRPGALFPVCLSVMITFPDCLIRGMVLLRDFRLSCWGRWALLLSAVIQVLRFCPVSFFPFFFPNSGFRFDLAEVGQAGMINLPITRASEVRKFATPTSTPAEFAAPSP